MCYHADAVTDRMRRDQADAGTMCVLLCIAVLFVTEGERAQPKMQSQSRTNNHTPKTKQKTLCSVTLVVLLLLLYTEQRKADKR